MAAISVGSVSVDVVPSARNFARDLRKQIVPDAARVGDDIGNSIGRGIRESLGDPLAAPLADSTRRQRTRAPKQGDEVAGAFAQGFQRRLRRAFSALPKADIDADSSDADKTITRLRRRLEALSEQTVGVDIDARDALNELAAIRGELESLSGDAAVHVRADVKAAAAELAAVQTQVDDLDGRQVDVGVSRRSVASFNAGHRSAALLRGELVSLVAAGVAVAPAAIAAGAGVVAFAALAAPSIVKVVGAQQDMATAWDSLDERQQVAALSVQDLTEEYKFLARGMQGETLATFNAGLSVTRALMPELVPITHEVTTALTAFANRTEAALAAPEAREFFGFLQQQAGPAVTQFGSAAFAATHLVASLTTALTPLAFGTLRTATAVAELAADLFDAAPLLAEMLTVSLALRSPIGGLGDLITRTGARTRTYSAATKGASLSTKALNLVTAAGPTLYLAAGAAIAFFAIKVATADSATDKLAAKLRIANDASGNNLIGYRNLGNELTKRYIVAVRESNTQIQETGYQYKAVSQAAQDYANQIAIARRQELNVTAGQRLLSEQLGITREQANQLATAAGVDLSIGITGSGRAAQQAQTKIRQYQAAVEAARNPTAVVDQALRQAGNSALTMKDRVNALKTALDAVFTPSINVYNTMIQLRQGFADLATAAGKSKASLGGNNEASRQLQTSFGRQLITVAELKTAILQKTGSETQARAATAKYLPVLYAFAGNNTDARAQVDALATSLGVATGRTNITKAAFIKLATQMTGSRDKAEALWREFKKIPGVTNTQSNAHTKAALAAIAKLQAKASALDGTTIDLRARMDISDAISKLESLRRYSNRGGRPGGPGGHVAEGGIMRFAQGGIRYMARGGALEAHFATAPTLLYGERETGGEAFIPLAAAKRARSEAILSRVAEIFGGTYLKGAAAAAAGGVSAGTSATGEAGDAATQQATNAGLAAATKRTVELNTAVKGLNASKAVAAQADKTALATLRTMTASTTQATTTGRTATAQLARTTTATRTSATATTAAGRATDTTRAKTVAMRAELGRTQGQLGRTGTAAVALTGKYRGIPKAVKTAISVNAQGRYTIKDLGSFATGGPVWLASGGPVYGAGTATSDSIPARLSNGEFVIRAQAHQRYGTEMLDAINEQRLAKGGSVTSGGPVSFTGMPAQVKGGLNKQRDTSNKWTAEYVGKEIKKLLQGPLGVVRAARSQIGQGDVGGENRNKYNSAFAWQGAPWCAAFVSWCIRAARAQRMYPGYPTAAVAGFNSRMKHVRTGQPGDLAAYRGNGHINIIASGPRGGGYLTIGGNQGPKVNSYVRGGQSSILRPSFAAGGPVDRRVFAERNLDPNDRNDPLVRLYSKLRPSQAADLGDVLNTLTLDTGGYLPPGTSLVDNGTGRPEPVLKPEQLAALVSGEGRSVHIGEHAQITITDTADADTVAQRADFLARSASF